ncbi:MAG TPA: PAS domain-containing protein [Ginsengibacter sp.]
MVRVIVMLKKSLFYHDNKSYIAYTLTIPDGKIKLQVQPGISMKPISSTTDDTLRHLAFDNSVQANIISIVSSGKIIMVNRAASKLLGYSKRELLAKNRATIFKTGEDSFKIMLKQRAADGHSIALTTAIKKSGKSFPCEITSSVFFGEYGIKQSITTILDISRGIQKQKNIDTKKEKIVADNIVIAKSKQKIIDTKKEKTVADNIVIAKSKQKIIDTKKEKIIAGNIEAALTKSDLRLEENNKWISYIAKTSYDVMWDWNLTTGQIYVGDSIEEVFGYKVQNNTINFKDFSRCLLPQEKETVIKKLLKTLKSGNKSWEDYYMFKCYDGSLAATKSRASVVRNKNGEATHLIGSTLDITRLDELEKKLKEQNSIRNENNDIFQLAAKLSYDGIWDWNLLTNEFFLGEGFEEIFGDTANDKGKMSFDWSSHLHPEDKETVEKGMGDAIASSATYWNQAYRFVKADGSTANVFCRANIIRDPGGKALRMIGVVHDLSKQTVIEEKLEREIKLKEMQIVEAMKEAKENERSEIGKELHDNVNQLLGASKLYIDMAKKGGEDSELYLSRSSEYTLTAIEEIRKLTKGLTSATIEKLGLYESIENIARDTMEVNKVKISLAQGSFRENSVNEKFKLNVFRIVQEGLNNILKHANATEVTISLTQNKKSIILSISDNGVGFDPANKGKGIGMGNIINRAELYNGNANFISQPGKGCLLTVTFPVGVV